MDIEEYLELYGISKHRFAEMCGVTEVTVANISKRRRGTNAALAMRIEMLTDGRVKASTLVRTSNCDRLKIAQEYDHKNRKAHAKKV